MSPDLQHIAAKFKSLPAGLSFKKKPKVEPQESSVPDQNSRDLSKLSLAQQPEVEPQALSVPAKISQEVPKLLFTRKPKVEPKEASVPHKNGQDMPKPLVMTPDLPFGQPIHQRPITIKDEAQDVDIPPECRIPFTLPPEVQVMLDSYVSGRPVVVVASNGVLRDRWSISLPHEYAYLYLEFFRVRCV